MNMWYIAMHWRHISYCTQGSISGDCLPLLVSQPLVNQHLFYTYSINADDDRLVDLNEIKNIKSINNF